jgi:hypothetical protein
MKTETLEPRTTWVENVELLDSELNNKIIKELASGKLKATQKHIIAGVECIEENKASIEKALTEQLNIKEIKEMLALKFSRKKLEYRAIVPNSLIKKMISGLPFYTFKTIDEEGKVKMTQENILNLSNNIRPVVFASMCLCNFMIGTLVFALFGNDLDSSASHSLMYLTCGLLVVFCVGKFFDTRLSTEYEIIIFIMLLPGFYFVDFFITKHSRNKLTKNAKKLIWPNMTDEDAKEDTDQVKVIRVKINLPEAPLDVQKRLISWKNAGYNPYLIVHECAFSVVIDKEVIGAMVGKFDPIICVDEVVEGKNSTIIIDLFGEIEEEKELLNRVEEYYKQLRLEYSIN